MSRRRKPKVPGSIYLNGSRWWWDVRLTETYAEPDKDLASEAERHLG